MDKINFLNELPQKLALSQYSFNIIGGVQVLKYKVETIGADQTISFDCSNFHIEVTTESCVTKGTPETISQLYQLISRINDLINIGTLEIVPETYVIRFKCGQILHSSTDPTNLIQRFIEYHNLVFPFMIDSVKEVVFHSKPIIEAVATFSNPYEIRQRM